MEFTATVTDRSEQFIDMFSNQKIAFSHVSNGSYRIERMEAVDTYNNSDHDEVLDAAITYKINGTYPSNYMVKR